MPEPGHRIVRGTGWQSQPHGARDNVDGLSLLSIQGHLDLAAHASRGEDGRLGLGRGQNPDLGGWLFPWVTKGDPVAGRSLSPARARSPARIPGASA